MSCKNCGTQNNESYNFCERCGTNISALNNNKFKNIITKKKIKILLGSLLFFMILFAFYILQNFNPETFKYYPICIFHKITGLYCAGCGSTRATYSLLHGNILKALDYNIFYVLCLPFFIIYTLNILTKYFFNKRIYRPIFLSKKTIIAITVLVIIYSICRNIPIYPFTILAP